MQTLEVKGHVVQKLIVETDGQTRLILSPPSASKHGTSLNKHIFACLSTAHQLLNPSD